MGRTRKDLPLLMSRAAVMEELGMSEWAIRQLVEQRKLTRVDAGKLVKFRGDDVQAYVDSLKEIHPDN